MFNVEARECLGYYMYGAGFYAREYRDAIALDPRPLVTYCDCCEKRPECWEGLRRRVQLTKPKEVAAYGIKPGLMVAELAKEGRPDPCMVDLLENFRRGNQDRGTN